MNLDSTPGSEHLLKFDWNIVGPSKVTTRGFHVLFLEGSEGQKPNGKRDEHNWDNHNDN
jgi:hypothetical protein